MSNVIPLFKDRPTPVPHVERPAKSELERFMDRVQQHEDYHARTLDKSPSPWVGYDRAWMREKQLAEQVDYLMCLLILGVACLAIFIGVFR